MLVGAYALIVLVAGRSVFALRDSQRAALTDQIETQLQDAVAAWEDALVQTLTGWMEATHADAGRAAALQHQMRRRAPWFDSLYVWEVPRRSRTPGDETAEPARIEFPLAEVREDREGSISRPCILPARILKADPRVPPERTAAQFVVGCSRESLETRLYAASEAATLLEDHGKVGAALAALDAAGLPTSLTLTASLNEGVSPFRVAIHRIQQAELLRQLGRTQEALDLLERVGNEILVLDAPNGGPLLRWVRHPILPHLARGGRAAAADRLAKQLERAERRLAAWHELDHRIATIVPRPETTELPQFIYDQYSEHPFVLYYGFEGTRGVALQLEQDGLVDAFLASRTVARVRPWLVITDKGGKPVFGTPTTGDLPIRVPFRVVLSHLRVALDASAIDELTRQLRGQWFGQIALVALCAVLGFAALIGQFRASRQQNELLERQREFTTRVTHELKTPLAGIRVMAENLESGAFRDETHLAEMASRIVAETDRLTERVNEVLAAARERAVPEPQPFDPEEAVFAAIDQWGPRLEAAGVSLTADVNPTAELRGDALALRDAIGCLLDNALKYRREDHPEPRVELTVDQVDRTVTIRVADNGLGVPVRLREAIFERFVRVEGPNRGTAGGYGLGLAQVREIARAHGGTVTCVDGIDGGAAFVLELPALEAVADGAGFR